MDGREKHAAYVDQLFAGRMDGEKQTIDKMLLGNDPERDREILRLMSEQRQPMFPDGWIGLQVVLGLLCGVAGGVAYMVASSIL